MSQSRKDRKFRQIIDYVEDQIGADINRDLLRVALTADDIPNGIGVNIQGQDLSEIAANISQIGGQAQSAVDVANQIDQIQNILSGQTLTVTDNGSFAISAFNGGTLTVTDDGSFTIAGQPLDVSGAEVDVDLSSQTLSPLTVTDDGSFTIAGQPLDVSGAEVDVDLSSQTLSPLTVTDDGSLAISAFNGGTLTVTDDGSFTISGTVATEQQSPVGVEDSSGSQVDPFDQADVGQISASDSGTGSSNAATLSLGDFRKDVDIYVDTSGSATLTVEVSEDGGTTWRQLDSLSYSSATVETEQYETAFADIRAYLNQNRNEVVAVSRGI